MESPKSTVAVRVPWNKGKLVGQKAPLKLREIWAIRIRLQLAERRRELALFNLAIDSKLRACDLVKLRVRDVCHGQSVGLRGRSFYSKRLKGSSSSRLPSRRGKPSEPGSFMQGWARRAACSRAAFTARRIYPPGTRGSWFLGQPTGVGQGELWDAHAQADEGNSHPPPDQEPTGRSAAARTHEGWRVPSVTSASRSTMPWRWLSRPRYSWNPGRVGRRLDGR
jgi:hypothetical protein